MGFFSTSPNFVAYNIVCQLSHFAWGALVTMIGAYFGHLLVGVGLSILWAVPKEFVYDIFVEGDTCGDSCTDCAFYMAGTVFAVLVVLLKIKVAS